MLGSFSSEKLKLGARVCACFGDMFLLNFSRYFWVSLPKTYFYKLYILFFNLHVSLISDWHFQDILILSTEGSSHSGSSCNQLHRALLGLFLWWGWGLRRAERNWDPMSGRTGFHSDRVWFSHRLVHKIQILWTLSLPSHQFGPNSPLASAEVQEHEEGTKMSIGPKALIQTVWSHRQLWKFAHS